MNYIATFFKYCILRVTLKKIATAIHLSYREHINIMSGEYIHYKYKLQVAISL